MMKAKFICLVCSFLLLLCAVGCSYPLNHDCNHLVIGSDAEGVVRVVVDYYAGENLRETVGACNADNSPLKASDTLHFDMPKMYGESFVCSISVVTEDGSEITNDNMKIELPFGKKNYNIRIIADENGDYALIEKGER